MGCFKAREIVLGLSVRCRGEWKEIYDIIEKKKKIEDEEIQEAIRNQKSSFVCITDESFPNASKMSTNPFPLYYYGDISLPFLSKEADRHRNETPNSYQEKMMKKAHRRNDRAFQRRSCRRFWHGNWTGWHRDERSHASGSADHRRPRVGNRCPLPFRKTSTSTTIAAREKGSSFRNIPERPNLWRVTSPSATEYLPRQERYASSVGERYDPALPQPQDRPWNSGVISFPFLRREWGRPHQFPHPGWGETRLELRRHRGGNQRKFLAIS